MRVIAPDFDRKIDLPGVGPCPRPVDIDQTVTGFSDLVSLRIYTFAKGSVIDGEAEGDEVYMVLLSGTATVKVSGADNAHFLLSETGTRAIYLPPHHAYQLSLTEEASVAYARAVPVHPNKPAGFDAAIGSQILADPGHADRLHMSLQAISRDENLEFESGERETLVFSTADTAKNAAWSTLALEPGEGAGLRAANDGLVLTVSA